MAEGQKNFLKEYKKDTVIFCEYEPGNAFYLIRKGKVKITKITEKYEKTIDILEEGSVFGEMAIIDQALRSATAIAETDVQLTEFTKENFKGILSTHAELLVNLIRIVCFRTTDAKRRLSLLQIKDDEGKVIDAILMLAEGLIRRNPELLEEKNIAINSTISDIGHWCGLDEKTAKSVIFNLEKMEKLESKPGAIIIKDYVDLRRILERKKKMAKLND